MLVEIDGIKYAPADKDVVSYLMQIRGLELALDAQEKIKNSLLIDIDELNEHQDLLKPSLDQAHKRNRELEKQIKSLEETNLTIVQQVARDCAKIAWNNEPDAEISDLILKHYGLEEDE